jgi:27-O-demethylrifamycin SV methyltransferase
MGTVEHNQQFYDGITDAWPFIFGANFHWGLFLNEAHTLEAATHNLILAMKEMVAGVSGKEVLDVGCGIGAPAIVLATQFGARVTAISISPAGIKRATQEAEKLRLTNRLKFLVADAMQMSFPEAAFDVVWVMESSHLMPEKAKLIAECHRVLRPGGRIVLCDLMLIRPLAAKEIVALIPQIRLLESSFGRARLDTLEYYSHLFGAAGFSSIQHRDISPHVVPTIKCWEENIATAWPSLAEYFSVTQRDQFLESCRILRRFYEESTWGYGIISGLKSSASPGA